VSALRSKRIVVILGSGPDVMRGADWPREGISDFVAINNAWRVRPDWDWLIYPEDFPVENQPTDVRPGQALITADRYIPDQNAFGGIVYAGGTMAFTAGYWALSALKPDVLAFLGCDMVYPSAGKTHFYGAGTADPLRVDMTLRSLEAKSARLMLLAAGQGCACMNLSESESRLVFPRVLLGALGDVPRPADPGGLVADVLAQEDALDYRVPSGRYWKEAERFDPAQIDRIDGLWLEAARKVLE
jgi:hypothetical protein